MKNSARMVIVAGFEADYDQALVAYFRPIRPIRTPSPNMIEPSAFDEGMAACAQGQWLRAAKAFEAWLKWHPHHPHAWSNLGNVRDELGDVEGALQAYRQAVQLDPEYRSALNNWALLGRKRVAQDPALLASLRLAYEAALQQNDWIAQAHALEALVDLLPVELEWLVPLAYRYRDLQRFHEALAVMNRILALEPAHDLIRFARADILRHHSRMDLARADYEVVIAHLQAATEPLTAQGASVKEVLAHAYAGLSQVCQAQGDLAQAAQRLDWAIALLPSQGLAQWQERRLSLRLDQGEHHLILAERSEQVQALQAQAHSTSPHALAEAYVALAQAHLMLNDHKGAEAALEAVRALREQQGSVDWGEPSAAWYSAMSRVCYARGAFNVGSEMTVKAHQDWLAQASADLRSPALASPLSPLGLAGKTLLIRCVMGLGDAIMLVRYALRAQHLGAHVVVQAPRQLVTLFASLNECGRQGREVASTLPIAVMAHHDAPPAHDVHCLSLALPQVFGFIEQPDADANPDPDPAATRRLQVPYAQEAYLFADAAKRLHWRERLAALPLGHLRVGLVWYGGAASYDYRRSVVFSDLQALLDTPSVCWISLQLEAGIAPAQQPEHPNLHTRFTAELHDFSDTAALMRELDLIITCDTATLHLGGALHCPVWAYTRLDAPHGLLHEPHRMPWYDSVRLFPQQAVGSWTATLETIRLALLAHQSAVFCQKAQWSLAQTSLQALVQALPNDKVHWNNLGNVHDELGDVAAAAKAYGRALQLDAHYTAALKNHALLSAKQNDHARAAEFARHYLALVPDDAGMWHVLGTQLYCGKAQVADETARGQAFEQALHAYRQAVRFGSRTCGGLAHQGLDPQAAAKQASFDHSAMQLLRDAALLESADALLREQQQRFEACADYNLHPYPALASCDDSKWHAQLAQRFAQSFAPAAQAVVAQPCVVPSSRERSLSSLRRVAFLSADWHDHPIGSLLAPLLEALDRSRWEVFAVALDQVADTSALRRRIESACTAFLPLGHLSDAQLAAHLRERDMDIAIDLSLYMDGGRVGVFAHRAAPVQLQWLGYPGTSGAPWYDGIIVGRGMVEAADGLQQAQPLPFTDPRYSDPFYTERVYTLPTPYLPAHTERPLALGHLQALQQPQARQRLRQRFGWNDDDVVLCAFNNPYKITTAMFDVWLEAMRAYPKTRLWLTEHEPLATRNLRERMTQQGVDASRLVVATRLPDFSEHLLRYVAADLFIDTFPYGAHSTAADALWCGLPLLTLRGQSFASRVGASILCQAGQSDWVATSWDDYRAKLARAIESPDGLRQTRSQLLKAPSRHALFDLQAFVRGFEAVLQQSLDEKTP